MPLLWDLQSRQQVPVPREQVLQALQSGQFGIPKGNVFIRGDVGEAIEIPSSEIVSALQRGYRLEEPEETQLRLHGDDEIIAAGEGLLRGATLGLSDPILITSGITTAEAIKGRKEANPGAATGGEIAALVGSALFSGGGTAAASAGVKGSTKLGVKALRTVSAPARLTTRLGNATANRLEAQFLKQLTDKTITRRAIAKGGALAAAGGVEGSIYGVGQAISEQSLGDTATVAESLVGHVGLGFLSGVAAGGILGMGGKLTTDAAKVASKKLKGLVAKKADAAEKAFKEGGLFDELGITVPKKKTGMEKEIAEVLTDESILPDGAIIKANMGPGQAIQRLKEAADAYGTGIRQTIDDIDAHLDNPSAFIKNDQQMAKELKAIGEELRKNLGDGRAAAGRMSAIADDLTLDPPTSFKGLWEKRQQLKQAWATGPADSGAKKASQEAERYFQKQIMEGAKKALGQNDDLLRQLKDYNKVFSAIGDVARKTKSPEVAASTMGTALVQGLKRAFASTGWRLVYGASALSAVAGGTAAGVFMAGATSALGAGKTAMQHKLPQLATKVGKLRTLQVALEKSSYGVGKALNNMGKASGAVRLGSVGIFSALTGKKDRKEAAKSLILAIHESIGNPEQLAARLGSTLAPLEDVAPDAARHMAMTWAQGIQYIQPRLPMPPAENMLQPERDWHISNEEVNKAGALISALSNPTGTIEELLQGMADPDALALIMAVYPNWAAHVLQDVLEKMAVRKDKLPRNVEYQIGKFLGIPPNGLYLPSSLKRAAEVHQGPQQAKNIGSPAKGGGELPDLGTNIKTQTQRVGESL